MKILIVDDDATNRLVLSAYLKKDGHSILIAENGQHALDVFKSEHPEMVLMDVMMPIMDGYEATQKIKEASEKFIPIMFLTAMTDEKALAKCVEVGGDDFLTKPYSRVILNAKINALTRVSKLYNTVYEQNKELERHNIQQLQEQKVANNVFNSIMHEGCLAEAIFDIHLSPVSLFNGDVVLAAEKASGGLNILFGDFTGHGLGAALGALPLSEIFYAMTAKGYGIADILQEINKKLKQQLPVGMFLAACMVELEPANKIVKIWNGAIPGAYILRCSGELIRLKSTNLPLAILSPSEFSNTTEILEVFDGDKIILTTDGILEAENPLGEMYGVIRFERNLLDITGDLAKLKNTDIQLTLKDEMIASVVDYAQEQAFNDDITLAVIDCDFKALDSLNTEDVKDDKILDSNWEFSFLLPFDTLQKIDPLPILNHILNSIMGKRKSDTQVNMILSELFCNALDHGLLELDSSLKTTPLGFMEFYEQKAFRLEKLDKGELKIKLKNNKMGSASQLTIIFEDSGKGFDTSKLEQSIENIKSPDEYSGRGVPLIEKYCESIKYNAKGNRVECVFHVK